MNGSREARRHSDFLPRVLLIDLPAVWHVDLDGVRLSPCQCRSCVQMFIESVVGLRVCNEDPERLRK